MSGPYNVKVEGSPSRGEVARTSSLLNGEGEVPARNHVLVDHTEHEVVAVCNHNLVQIEAAL